MAAKQERDIGTGRVPGLNTERLYTTTIPAEELAQALTEHFRAQGFEAQVFRASGDRTVMQARKESLWRNLLGVAYALTVVFTTGEGQLSIGLGGHEWVDTAVSGAIGLVAVPPVLLGTAYGIWKENQLDNEVWRVIDERVNAPTIARLLGRPDTVRTADAAAGVNVPGCGPGGGPGTPQRQPSAP